MDPSWWEDEVQRKVSAIVADRDDKLKLLKPGVSTLFTVFSTWKADRIWQTPLYAHFQPELNDLLASIVGTGTLQNIVRAQFARMVPGAKILPHADRGDWSSKYAPAQPLVCTHPRTCDSVVGYGDQSWQALFCACVSVPAGQHSGRLHCARCLDSIGPYVYADLSMHVDCMPGVSGRKLGAW